MERPPHTLNWRLSLKHRPELPSRRHLDTSSHRFSALWHPDPAGVSGGGCGEALSWVPTRGRAVPAGAGAPGQWRRRGRRELAAAAVRAAGPVRGRRAPRSSLAHSSPMLIFGLGRPCPGISRHASRRPVCRPEPGGRRESDSGGCSSSPECAADPPAPSRALPRPLPGHGHRAARFVAEDITVMSAFNLLHLVTKSQPVALRACGLPSGSCRDKKNCKVVFSQQELRKRLTPLQYHVTQEKGTESAFEGEYTHHKDPGIYKCVVCGTPLFKSETKFDSGSGWPSFHDVISSEAIELTDDFSYGMHRVETSCSQCGAHLGHIFDDGPRPTGKRYCINSASLSFSPADSTEAEGGGGRESGSPAVADRAEL